MKVVPYVLGEAAYWGEDLSGNSAHADATGQAGVKASLPIWRADPTVQSELFNLNGLAHKVTFEAEIPVRRRQPGPRPNCRSTTSSTTTRPSSPGGRWRSARSASRWARSCRLRFDERFFALRSDLQGSVTSPTEIADDLMEVRLGLNQRWQTKRGLPGQQRIIDWIVLDVGAVLFPDSDRDNFGEALGLVDYDFRWHVGDRLTLLSDGFYDVFDQGLRQVDRRRPHQPAGARQRLCRLPLDRRADQQRTCSPARSATG